MPNESTFIDRVLSTGIWLHILFWLMISMIFYVFFSMFIYESFSVYLVNLIAILPSQIAISYFLMYYLIPKLLLKRKYLVFTILFILALYLSMVLARFLTIYVVEDINERGFYKESIWEILTQIGHLFSRYFLSVLLAPMILIPVKLLKDRLEDKTKFEQLEKERSNAQLKLLKSQIHPHFLFNTLNNLYLLTLEKRAEAPEVVLKLSEMLDYMLYQCNELSVLLVKEIELLRNYIDLEKLRYASDAEITLTSKIADPHARIAPLLLLTLVENAFKHGGENNAKIFYIRIDIEQMGPNFNIKIVNTLAEEQKTSLKKGIGLENLTEQLHLQYPDQHHMVTAENEDTYSVDLKIQLEE